MSSVKDFYSFLLTGLNPIYYLFLLALLSCITSCSDQSKQAPEFVIDFDFDKIKERGYLIALVDNSSTGLFVYKGKTMGYEYELLKMFTDSMGLGLRLEIVPNIDDAFKKLNSGIGDVIAFNMTVTKERKERIQFTTTHTQVRQMLVQRKPENWRELKQHEIENNIIRNPIQLVGKQVWVRYQSSFGQRMKHLSEEVGGEISISEDSPNVTTEDLIKKVAEGYIDYTIADENVAMVNAAYYAILDVNTPVSFPQQIAWGVRKNADSLLLSVNQWIAAMQKTTDYYTIYDKYFKSSRSSLRRKEAEFSSLSGDKISPYDDLIKKYATELGWDWRLLAAQIYKESKFNPVAESWMGAIGLMQVMPSTGEQYGISKLKNPDENIFAGSQQIKWMQDIWKDAIIDEQEKIKFILASYNVGQGHVLDARRLAEKYGEPKDDWNVVSKYLIKKSLVEFYTDSVVQYGYCRGDEPVRYVEEIFTIFDNYQKLFPDKLNDATLETQMIN
jgi:membrane-bound lytic murein transglycosylase F